MSEVAKCDRCNQYINMCVCDFKLKTMSEAEKKANELMESFKCWRHVWNRTECDYVSEIDYPAIREYALICVDKIIEELADLWDETDNHNKETRIKINERLKHYNEVKQILTNK